MRKAMLVMLSIGLLILPAAVVAAPLPAATCQNIAGTFQGQAVPTDYGFDVYNVELTGPLAGHPEGEKLVEVTIHKVTPGGTIHFTGIHIFDDTDFGRMVTHDQGSIAPNGRVRNTLVIVEGGSGFVNVYGIAELSTGAIDISYNGRVCPE
jgi:hypothetical protein